MTSITRRTVVALGLAVALVLSACSGDDSSTPADPALPGDPTGGSDPPTEITLDGSTDNDPDVTAPSAEEAGTCGVEVTGDETANWTASGGVAAVNTEYWLTPEQKEFFGDGFYFIVACDGGGNGGYLGILAGSGATSSSVPFRPATYTLTPADSTFGGAGPDSSLTVLLTLDGDDGVWGVSEPGTIRITEFDADGISGSVTFTATDVLAGVTGGPERTIQVSAVFAFTNPN